MSGLARVASAAGTAAAAAVIVRPLVPADADEAIALVRGHEFASEHPSPVLRRLFDHGWDPAGPGLGYVLQAGERIVGVIFAIRSNRLVDGVATKVANMSTWYVESRHRSHSLTLLKALCAERDVTLTNFSASAAVVTVLGRLGFETLSRRRLFMPAWLARLLPRWGKARVIDSAEGLERMLPADLRKIRQDHLAYELGHYAAQDGGRPLYVVTKRRTLKGEVFLPAWVPQRLRRRRFPVSDVLFVSDPQAALRQWPALRWHIARRESTIGLTVQESFLGEWVPEAPAHEKLLLVRRGVNAAGPSVHAPIDALYTEIVLLPLS